MGHELECVSFVVGFFRKEKKRVADCRYFHGKFIICGVSPH